MRQRLKILCSESTIRSEKNPNKIIIKILACMYVKVKTWKFKIYYFILFFTTRCHLRRFWRLSHHEIIVHEYVTRACTCGTCKKLSARILNCMHRFLTIRGRSVRTKGFGCFLQVYQFMVEKTNSWGCWAGLGMA